MFDAAETARAPMSMTRDEQAAVLRACEGRRYRFRDQVIISLALGTGLREHEIVALDNDDVFDGEGHARQRFPLRTFKGHRRARSRGRTTPQEAILPDSVRALLQLFRDHKRSAGQSLLGDAPLFVSQKRRRLSARMVREMFAGVQAAAGLERRFTFHHTRHSFCTDLYLLTGNLRLVQRAARHASIQTTVIYTHPPDEQLLHAIRGLDAARGGERLDDHFGDTGAFTSRNLVLSESAPGTPRAFSAVSQNWITPPGSPPTPRPAPCSNRPRRVSARRVSR